MPLSGKGLGWVILELLLPPPQHIGIDALILADLGYGHALFRDQANRLDFEFAGMPFLHFVH